jgi:hypothetical protein
VGDLLWRRAGGGQLPAGSSVSDGKLVEMEGRHYAGGLPRNFDVYRPYSPLVAACAHAIGRPARKHGVGDRYGAYEVKPGVARSEPLPLATSRVTGAHRWQFTDGTLWSPVLRTVRFARVCVRGGPRVPLGPASVGAEIEVDVPLGLEDPQVALSVLLPWARGTEGGTVDDVLREELTDEDGELDEELYAGVLAYAAAYLNAEPSAGWEVSIHPGRLEVEPGLTESAPLYVTAPGPGAIAVAVLAVNLEDPEQRAVSDVVLIDRDQDGSLAVLYGDG